MWEVSCSGVEFVGALSPLFASRGEAGADSG
jgi:hypothetical protein